MQLLIFKSEKKKSIPFFMSQCLPARLALVPMGLVYHAHSGSRLASINQSTSDASFKKSRASVASQDSIVLSRTCVPTHNAQQVGLAHTTHGGSRDGDWRRWRRTDLGKVVHRSRRRNFMIQTQRICENNFTF